MNQERKCKIEDISKSLVDKFNAIEVSLNELRTMDCDIELDDFSEDTRIYKIIDESFIHSLLSDNEKEEINITLEHLNNNSISINKLSYDFEISTGKRILVILESKDGDYLSGFIMKGNGQQLFDYLSSFTGEYIKNNNPLDEIIDDLRHFRPYGKYFK
ncbi:MAG: hypothetical protein ACRC92_17480 [Peptostreptococcaceae bacterium]